MLEVGTQSVPYTFALATLFKTICIAMLVEGSAADIVHRVKEGNYTNITVLAPRNAHYDTFFTLARCEHFDVVIVHDVCSQLHTAGSKFIDALVKLGDYVFIEASHTKFQSELKKKKISFAGRYEEIELYFSYKPKASLDIARFTQKDRAVSTQPKYHIKSTYNEKLFSKKGLEKPLKWVDGINLVTFAMLRGVYPEDGHIRKQIVGMKKTHREHNDLVLGNIIVQGQDLIPIDVNDSRRNADLHTCITSALRAFKEGNIRHKNPERWIHEYYDMCSK